MNFRSRSFAFLLAFIAALTCAELQAQNGYDVAKPARTSTEKPQPGAAGETPLDSPAVPAVKDTSTESSPLTRDRVAPTIRIGTGIRVTVSQPVGSGTQRNGDLVQALLVESIRTSTGALLPRGTHVVATVVSSAKAGTIASGGVLSIELMRVGSVAVVSDVRDFNGAEGHKDVADSAPARGSEAEVQAGTELQFHVMS